MLHNAFLVHDDIEDGSESRRGAPTLHRTRRRAARRERRRRDERAVDAACSARNVDAARSRASPLRIFDEVDHMLRESLEGQALELGWIRDNDRATVEPDDYLRLVLKKTAWYSFIHPMRIGAIVAEPMTETWTASTPSASCSAPPSRSRTTC